MKNLYENGHSWDLKEAMVCQNDPNSCLFDFSPSRESIDMSHDICSKILNFGHYWVFWAFWALLDNIILSIQFLILSRVHRYVTCHMSEIDPKMGILGLLGKLWLVPTKNQMLLAHLEHKPKLLAKTRVKSVHPFSSYIAYMIREKVRK
jgi:hypothetical protein